MDSECRGTLVCRFGYCRPRCANDKDCADLPGSRCVVAGDGEGVCILPDVEACVFGLECPAELVCIDLACRVRCESSDDCLASQACFQNHCRQRCGVDGECIDADRCVEGLCQPAVLAPRDASMPDGGGSDSSAGDSSLSDSAVGDSGSPDASSTCVADEERCNGNDDDCDGRVDEDTTVAGFADLDRDGHGDPSSPLLGCATNPGLSFIDDDCLDSDPNVHGSQPEICDGIDNDCDSRVDEATGPLTWFRDGDGDGFGSPASGTVSACAPPDGFSLLGTDCDDGDPTRSPGAPELCDGADNDCNGLSDFVVAPGDFEDDDADGFPDSACAAAAGDCDDDAATVHPGAPELMDGVDNDCDPTTADACTMVDWFPDADGDGFGDAAAAATRSCVLIEGQVTRAGDCDDGDTGRSPGALESCDGVDDDCDGRVDEDSSAACAVPRGVGACVDGMCGVAVCQRGWNDCDGASGNGCEIQVASDPDHCGTCDTVCASAPRSTPHCVAGSCQLMCVPDQGDCNLDPADGCEADLLSDAAHCGSCDVGCGARPNATSSCAFGACVLVCEMGFTDCNGVLDDGCETPTGRSLTDCGACGRACPLVDDVCAAGACIRPSFPCADAELAFEPDGLEPIVELTPGAHAFTSIRIPADVTVVTSGNGTLELCSQGDVVIEGSIDLSGGAGGVSFLGSAGGGATGDRRGIGETAPLEACGPAGVGGAGTVGGDGERLFACVRGVVAFQGRGGAFGGGASGLDTNGPSAGGGGGYAGGGGGAGTTGNGGGDGASFMSDVGGAGGRDCGGGAGGAGPAPYAGGAAEDSADCASSGGGGGGGAIGAAAAADLAVAVTFRPGSGGGGAAGAGAGRAGGGGGGGGGGALRVSSATRIHIASTGSIRVNGGAGGSGGAGGGGGGGSGGVVYLAAPEFTNDGEVSAVGGLGGRGGADGGAGGAGRIRLSTLECSGIGSYEPQLPELLCRPTGVSVPGRVFVGTFPD